MLYIFSVLAAVLLYILLHRFLSPSIVFVVKSQPALLQFVEAFFIAQLAFYFVHRLSHQVSWLWRFHSIHHSSAELDWLASARVHPIEMIIVNVAAGVPLFLLGFSRETLGAYLVFGAVLPIFNHANINFRFPILNRLISTPEFHHWHHSNDPEARNKNFSGFPIIDLLFGTYYVPDRQMPQTYGIDEYVPNNYWQQLMYPFRR